MLTIGIDVGITGALAIVDQHANVVLLEDLPIMQHGKCKWVDAMHLIDRIRWARDGIAHVLLPARAYVEHVHAMPSMGTVASNSKGLTLGSTLAALQVAGVPIELIQPAAWKRALGLIHPKGTTDGEKKNASLTRARMLFPSAELGRMRDHNRAEALLLCSYAQRHLQGAKAA